MQTYHTTALRQESRPETGCKAKVERRERLSRSGHEADKGERRLSKHRQFLHTDTVDKTKKCGSRKKTRKRFEERMTENYTGLEKPSDIPREVDHYTVSLGVDALKSCEDNLNDGSSADTTNQGQVGPWLST
jgi:hypothetical protein